MGWFGLLIVAGVLLILLFMIWHTWEAAFNGATNLFSIGLALIVTGLLGALGYWIVMYASFAGWLPWTFA